MTTHNIFLCLGFRAPSIRECETIEEYHQYELLFSKMRFEEFPIINSLTDCVRPCQYNEYRLLTEKRPTSFETPHFPVAFSSRTRATTEETEEILYPWYGKCIVQEKVRQHFVGPLLSRRLAVSLDFFLVSPSWPSGTGSFGWGQFFSSWIMGNTLLFQLNQESQMPYFGTFRCKKVGPRWEKSVLANNLWDAIKSLRYSHPQDIDFWRKGLSWPWSSCPHYCEITGV